MLLIRMFPVITGRTLVLKSHAKNLELVPKQNHSTNDQTQNRNKVYNQMEDDGSRQRNKKFLLKGERVTI